VIGAMPGVNTASSIKELVGGIVLHDPFNLAISEVIEPLEQESSQMDAELELASKPPFPWAVVRFRSGSTISARACQGMTWANWINGWVGETSIVTGCPQQGVSSPERPMLMGRLPSRLYGVLFCGLVTMKAS
jgi:hypothetical protein